jgi:putative flippase GtrA
VAVLTIRGKHVHLGRRQFLFVLVGATCFLTQYSVLTVMAAAGVNRPLANALGFVLSAQLNFLLSSRLTWRDRRVHGARALCARLVGYNGTALLSLGVNTAAFTLVYQRVGNLAGAAIGVACGMCVTYLICDLIIFRNRASGGIATSDDSSASGQHAVPAERGILRDRGRHAAASRAVPRWPGSPQNPKAT